MESATRGETSGEKFGQKHAVRAGTAGKVGRGAGTSADSLVLPRNRAAWHVTEASGSNFSWQNAASG
jgi:hypothetical protein